MTDKVVDDIHIAYYNLIIAVFVVPWALLRYLFYRRPALVCTVKVCMCTCARMMWCSDVVCSHLLSTRHAQRTHTNLCILVIRAPSVVRQEGGSVVAGRPNAPINDYVEPCKVERKHVEPRKREIFYLSIIANLLIRWSHTVAAVRLTYWPSLK